MNKRTGFTIIELLSVLTMLAVLMSVLFPVGEKIVEKTRRAATASDLRQIALSCGSFLSENDDNWQIFSKINKISDLAQILADANYITEPTVYFTKTDSAMADKDIPKTIGQRSTTGFAVDKTFEKTPAHFVIITKISKNAPPSTTPIAYTRGLDTTTGSWTNLGVYGQDGGYIAFLDGHVRFYKKLELQKYNTGEITNSIREAVNPEAAGFDWEGKIW